MASLNLDTVPQWFALPIGKDDWYIITPEPASENPPGLARNGVILSEKRPTNGVFNLNMSPSILQTVKSTS